MPPPDAEANPTHVMEPGGKANLNRSSLREILFHSGSLTQSGYSWTKTVRRKNTGNYQTMRIVLTSKYLRINKAENRVSSKHFCSEPEWAQVSALAVEDEFCTLRTLNSRLSTISKALSAAQNILNTAKKY